MSDIRHSIETELALLLGAVISDVAVLPGRSSGIRPPEYVCVIVDKTESRSMTGDVVVADVNVLSVIPADDPDASVRSKDRFHAICEFFRDINCPFHGIINNILVYGYYVGKQEDAQKDRSHGDILRLIAGVGFSS
ncbi:MAG: hypothetical protein WCO60_18385 [Verrucomicrobiota bacterium]